MTSDEKMNVYLRKLQEATGMDEAAGSAARVGRTDEAAEKYRKASALYAAAAEYLLDLMENADASERTEYQQSIDRLIAVSAQMKKMAASTARRGKEAGAPSKGNGSKLSQEYDEEEQVKFEPEAEIPKTGFSEIAGLEEAKQIVTDEIINPLIFEDVYSKFKRGNRGGLLLFGPPGGGKTMMARAIAAESHMAFFPVRCSDIVGRYFGEAEKRVRALFQAAREATNAVIFMDEAEALACRRGGNSTVMNRLVPELLSQIDGFTTASFPDGWF